MLEADERLIKWLLHQSGEPIAGIAKGTGMAWTTVSDLKKKETLLEKTSFENASKLTVYAKRLKGEVKMKFENLTAVHFDGDNGIYELEFNINGEIEFITIEASDHPKAATDEDYFDDKEVVNKIIKDQE